MAWPGERVVLKWINNFLPYLFGALVVLVKAEGTHWICVGAFCFSALMSRTINAKDLAEMAGNAKDIINRKKPSQLALEEPVE